MPMHFAASEFILTIACLGAMWILWNRSIRFAAIAMGILGLAAGLGTIRFAFGLGPDFAAVHRMVSQHGGLIAAGLIALSLVDGVVSPARRRRFLLVTGGAVAVSVSAGLINSSLQPLILLAWAVIIMLLSLLQPFQKPGTRLLAFTFAAILPLNALFVRRSPALGVDLSWHLYHVLLAVWVVALAVILVSTRDESTALVDG
jgi:hypothetical protein